MLRFDSPGPDLTRALTMFTGCEIVRDRQARTITVTIRNYTQKLAVRYKGKFTLNDLPYAASKAKREEFESDAPSSCMQKKEGDMQDSSNMQKKEGDVSENARVINEGIEALQAAKFRSLEYCITILKHAKQRAEERSIATRSPRVAPRAVPARRHAASVPRSNAHSLAVSNNRLSRTVASSDHVELRILSPGVISLMNPGPYWPLYLWGPLVGRLQTNRPLPRGGSLAARWSPASLGTVR